MTWLIANIGDIAIVYSNMTFSNFCKSNIDNHSIQMTSLIVNKVNIDAIDTYMTQQCDTLIITDVGMCHIVCTISL